MLEREPVLKAFCTGTAVMIIADGTLMICCRCLTYRQEDRLDVTAAAAQPYLVMKRSRQGSAAAAAASPAPAQKPA